jgi:hypothetical protein
MKQKGNVGAMTAADAAGNPKPGEHPEHNKPGDNKPAGQTTPNPTPGGQKPTGTPGQTTGNT